MRVLLIEDDQSTARGLAALLRLEGFVVDTAELGEEGLKIGKIHDYDVVLLDLMLPDIDGYKVLQSLRLAKVDTPVLILSGLSEVRHKIKGFNIGADDYLTKPFQKSELIARIQALTRRSNPSAEVRDIRRLTRKTLAVVLAGGRGSRLGTLTEWRSKPAVPFAGKFRIIDFVLSNCLNSDIRKVCVLTQYKAHSLIQHLMKGWTSAGSERREFLDLVPAQQWRGEDGWYEGTADAVYQGMDIIEGYKPEYVLILAGDHVYTMDYGAMLATHVESNADFTIACKTVPIAEARGYGVMKVDSSGRIVGFQEKPADPEPLPDDASKALVSMGIYVSALDFLKDRLSRDAERADSSHDFGKDIIPRCLDAGFRVQAHNFTSPTGGKAYWRDVGTIDSFFQANLEQLSPTPPIDLHDPSWPILTHHPQLPPAHLLGEPDSCRFSTSMISAGCIVDSSSISRSLLFSNVTVETGCELDRVLALPGCHIGAGSKLTNVILDKRSHVPPGTVIGMNLQEDSRRFVVTPDNIIVVNREMLGQGTKYMPSVFNCELTGAD